MSRALVSIARLSAVLLGPPVLLSCAEPMGSEIDVFDARPYVTGRALADLSPQGTFRFSGPEFDSFPISAERARDLGVAWLRTNAFPDLLPPGARSIGEQVEEEHGPIDWNGIRAAPNPLAAFTPYADDEMMPPALRSILGPYFVVTVLFEGRAIAAIGVSVYNTDHSISADGELTYVHVPNAYAFGLIGRQPIANVHLKPERAVKTAYDSTGGLRVTEVPVFMRPSRLYSPEISYWCMTLERLALFERVTDGAVVSTDVIYVTPEGWLMLPIGELDDALPYYYQEPDSSVVLRHYTPILAPGMFTRFDRVSLHSQSSDSR